MQRLKSTLVNGTADWGTFIIHVASKIEYFVRHPSQFSPYLFTAFGELRAMLSKLKRKQETKIGKDDLNRNLLN